MYEVEKRECYPDNFHLGHFPAVTGICKVKAGETVRKYAPVSLNADGTVQETSATTIDQFTGIAADFPSGEDVVYYKTLQCRGTEVVLPDNVSLEALSVPARKLSIFFE